MLHLGRPADRLVWHTYHLGRRNVAILIRATVQVKKNPGPDAASVLCTLLSEFSILSCPFFSELSILRDCRDECEV
jgi:hypothetical protein